MDQRRRQSILQTNERNHFFDEHFKFPVSHDDLRDKSLLFQVDMQFANIIVFTLLLYGLIIISNFVFIEFLKYLSIIFFVCLHY